MFAKIVPLKLIPFWHCVPLTSCILYAGTIALAEMGTVKAVVPDGRPLMLLADSGTSVSPKLVNCCWNCVIPVPLPTELYVIETFG